MKLTVIGLSITSSWGNGHATTFRALLKAFKKLGHDITFLERDVEWYSRNRDMPKPRFCDVILYRNLEELEDTYAHLIANADAVMVGSYVPEGVAVNELVFSLANGTTMFYDIDTPVTLAKLERGDYEYLKPEQIKHFDHYLSFTGGPILDHLMEKYGSPSAKPLYCSVDVDLYYPEDIEKQWQMGYLGTYSIDRQPTVEELLNQPAAKNEKYKFLVAGPQYPADYQWAPNVHRIEHLPPAEHRSFYNSQCYTLNVTREDMIKAGYSPSVRLFEAAACGVPIISDYWEGMDEFFIIGSEILIAHSAEEVSKFWQEISEEDRQKIAKKAREKVLTFHTSMVRANELEQYIVSVPSPSEKI